jgi:hypothetical protein
VCARCSGPDTAASCAVVIVVGWNGRGMVGSDMESPHAATRQRAQTLLAANAARPLDLIDASPVPLVAAGSAGGDKTHFRGRTDRGYERTFASRR